jgi:hypothetical protein
MASGINEKDPAYDSEFTAKVSRRWSGKIPSENWGDEQCELCLYYIPLLGILGSDYGVCTNVDSEFDGVLKFEHNGCDEHVFFDDSL